MQNTLDPNWMTTAERLAELGEILAAGLLRHGARERETLARRPLEPTKGCPLPHRSWKQDAA